MISWPKDWAEEEGWPRHSDRPLGSERRQWQSLVARTQKIRGYYPLSAAVEALGGPQSDFSREGIVKAIVDYHEVHGGRPLKSTSREWRRRDVWLRKKCNPPTSLRKLNDDLNLPGGYKLDRSISELKADIESYYKEHGERPLQTTSTFWDGWNDWLRRKSLPSLVRLCNDMGLPKREPGPGPKEIEARCRAIRKEIHTHKRERGTRPTAAKKEWKTQDAWLRRNIGMGLSAFLDQEGIR